MPDDAALHPHGDEERLLLLAATPKDADMTRRIFAAVGVPCVPCENSAALAKELGRGVGTVVLTDQAVFSAELRPLIDHLRNQPAWSDLPVLLLAGGGADSPAGRRAMELLGNVTVLERPVHTASLVSVVRTLIRSRRRQYQIRAHMAERERAQAEREALLNSERAARSEAERIGRVKDEFLATLSHELRTPLNAILGWAQILRTPHCNGKSRRAPVPRTPEDEELSQGLETIERNARVQTQIIEDLLDMSRIISGKIRLDVQSVELVRVVEAALDTVRPAAEAKSIHVEKHFDADPGAVWGDPGRLQQVLWNLLSNAIKFTPRGGHVDVTIRRVGTSQVEVTVSDTGEGIDPQFLPHVFDRFRQADASTTRRHGGLGLGLAIVQQLVELHGGVIHARSAGRGQGAVFVMSLPLTSIPVRPHSPDPVRRGAVASMEADDNPGLQKVATGKRYVSLDGVDVLVVDDDDDARELLGKILQECDARVRTAGSAAEAFDAVRSDPPDVIVSDIAMPGEDGYALIRRIRELDEQSGGATPAVALTAYARPEDRSAALRNGFQVHVPKPVQPAELIATIANLANREPVPASARA